MDNELYHYGVKGMKWGQRKFIPRIGRRRRAAAQPIVSIRKRLSGSDSTQIAQRRKAVRRASNLKKVAKGAAIVGGTALAAYGVYKMHGVLKDSGNRKLIKAGVKMYTNMAKGHAENVYNKASNFYRNTKYIINAPKRAIQSTGIGKAAVTGFAGATLLSDANSIQQWVRRIHKNGKVTGKDIKDLGIDILNPIPNNIPRFDKMIKSKLNHGESQFNELYHHGVKGMKWGIRKDRGTYKSRKQRRYERSDYAKAKSMSDAELRERINRINLEQSYISAVSRDKAAYKMATDSVLVRNGKKLVSWIRGTSLEIGESSIKNAVKNTINEKYPITRKRK